MPSILKTILKSTVFFGIGFGILYFLYIRQQEAYLAECALKNIAEADCNLLDKVWADIKSADYFYIGIALILYMLSNVARALRWKQLLEPLGYRPTFFNSLASIMAGYLTNLGIPRSGEFIRAGLLSKYESLKPEKVMGTIVTDRLADLISLLVVIGLTFLLSFSQIYSYLQRNAVFGGGFLEALSFNLLVGIFLIVLVLLYLAYRFRRAIKEHRFYLKLKDVLRGFWEGIKSVLALKRPGLFIFYSLIIWLCYYLMTYVIFFAYGPTTHLSPLAGLVVFVFGTLGIVIPSPGGMGSYHFLIGEGLALYGINGGDAFAFANILFFSVQIFVNVLFGILAFVLLPLVNEGVISTGNHARDELKGQ